MQLLITNIFNEDDSLHIAMYNLYNYVNKNFNRDYTYFFIECMADKTANIVK